MLDKLSIKVGSDHQWLVAPTMSALSFLSKKSWHSGLQKNQERVWNAERSALEERRKLDELRKERDREREIQELQRMQAEAGGGKKHQEKVDWMYATPATGSGPSASDLEEYLLGKKRVDKLLKQQDTQAQAIANQEVGPSSASAGGNTIQNDRDVSDKIRLDPMFSIKQQEQAAYQALLKDPARLRAMRAAAGLPDKDGRSESKEERRRRKEEKRRRKEERRDRSDHRDRSPFSPPSSSRRRDRDYSPRRRDASPPPGRRDDYPRRERREDDWHASDRRRDAAPSRDRREEYSAPPRRRDDYSPPPRRRNDYSPPPRRRDDDRRRDNYSPPSHRRERRSPPRQRHDSPPPLSSRRQDPKPNGSDTSKADAEAIRAAKLAQMQSDASTLSTSRAAQLTQLAQTEAAELAREEALRAKLLAQKNKGLGQGQGRFLEEQQKMLYGASSSAGNEQRLEDRLKGGAREGLQRFGKDD